MTPLTQTLAIVTAYWCVIYSLNHLSSLLPLFIKQKYSKCQEFFGLHTTFGYMRCYTKRFNVLCKVWGRCCQRPLARAWFNVGVVIGLGLMVTSLIVLMFSLYQSLFGGGGTDKSEQVLTPIMPGVNLPWNQILYYFLTLLICGIFHELGHALAAVTEQVRINGFGLFIMFLYPGAFVDLHTDHLTVISPLRQLRIFTAGVWHNIILVGVASCLLLTSSYILAPLYTTGRGAVVTMVTKDSALRGKLYPGVAIVQINSCPITNGAELSSCVGGVSAHRQKGYCISKGNITKHKLVGINGTQLLQDESRECCQEDKESHLCFSLTIARTIIESESKLTIPTTPPTLYVCLMARKIVSDERTCVTNDDCSAIQSDSVCVTPAIGPQTHLIKIHHTGPGDSILYLGDLIHLQYTLQTTNYYPLYSYAPVWLPATIERFLMYVASLSAALALLNIMPAYALDGHWALSALLEYVMPENVHRTKILNIILMFGSTLLVANVLIAFWILFNW